MAIVDEQLNYLGRDVAPHTVTEQRTMVNDKSKNKELQARMKDAMALTEEGNYRSALDSYLRIYSGYRSVAAAENASILYEALGETRTAANFMQRVLAETGSPAAQGVRTRLNRILLDQATLASDYGSASSQIEKVAAYASNEIQAVLPANAKVWIYNNASRDPIAEAVVDNLISDFIRKGIGIVDRQNASLIDAEQRFQMSGNVSDYDFVRIGSLVGANTIATIGISGTGAMRRLQVRVLDIEKGIPIMQSNTSDNWRL
jgi:hypothetical protein